MPSRKGIEGKRAQGSLLECSQHMETWAGAVAEMEGKSMRRPGQDVSATLAVHSFIQGIAVSDCLHPKPNSPPSPPPPPALPSLPSPSPSFPQANLPTMQACTHAGPTDREWR